eukprot:TRINITY_DN12088_c0_g1_i2.p1 TRINITY_DN12088_c0_g1~~TRINITY_DN12088_c0_g1_i2.p1  ORF type:complete len:813 (-),score=189.42 TRINITY_DN12088_c0_g1_i2:479-2917(-)
MSAPDDELSSSVIDQVPAVLLAQFVSVAQCDQIVAAKWLLRFDNNCDAALFAYFNETAQPGVGALNIQSDETHSLRTDLAPLAIGRTRNYGTAAESAYQPDLDWSPDSGMPPPAGKKYRKARKHWHEQHPDQVQQQPDQLKKQLRSRPYLVPPSDGSAPFLNLPDDVLVNVIAPHLNASDVCALSATNKSLNRAVTDDYIWKSLYMRNYGTGWATFEQLQEITDWRTVYIRKSRYGISQRGFERQRHPIIRFFIAVFIFLFQLVLVPFNLAMFCMFSHRSARILKQTRIAFTADKQFVQLTYRLAIQVLAFLTFDVLLFVGLPIIMNFFVIGTVYRAPLNFMRAWTVDEEKPYDADQLSFFETMRCELYSALSTIQQGFLVLVDLFMLIVFVLPVVLTVYRLPDMCRDLHKLSYTDLLMGRGYTTVWSHTRNILPCTGCCTFCVGDLTEFLLGMLSCLIVALLAPIVLVIGFHRAIEMIKLFKDDDRGAVGKAHIVLVELALIGFDLLFAGLPFIAFIINIATLYRAPYAISRILGESERRSGSLFTGFYMIGYAVLTLLDLMLWPLLFVIILLTGHRLPALFQELHSDCDSYEKFMDSYKGTRVLLATAKDAVICGGCLGIFAVLLQALLFLAVYLPACIILLFSCSQHSVLLCFRFNELRTKGGGLRGFHNIVISQLIMFLWDILAVGLNFMGFWVTMATIYRVPAMFKKLSDHADDLGTEFRMCDPTWWPLGHGAFVLLDIFFTVTLFPILLFTCFRLPALFSGCSSKGYYDTMDSPLLAAYTEQLKQFGCCSGRCGQLLARFCSQFCG